MNPDCDRTTTDPRATEWVDACPVCNSSRIDFLLLGKSRYSDHRFRYDRCEDCGLVFINPRIPEIQQTQALGRRKQTHLKYLPTQAFDIAEASASLVRPALQLLAGEGNRTTRWLDVGCGVGNLLAAAQARGVEGYGLDADPSLIAWAVENRPGIQFAAGTLDTLPFPAAFDVISADNVLEHINEGRVFLEKIHALLADGGLLVLRVPNHLSVLGVLLAWSGRLGSSFLIDPDAHPVNYSRSSLCRLVRETGFSPVAVNENLSLSYGLRRLFRRAGPEGWKGARQIALKASPVLGWVDRLVPWGGLNVTLFARKD